MAAPEKPVSQGQHKMCILCCWMQESQEDAQQMLLLQEALEQQEAPLRIAAVLKRGAISKSFKATAPNTPTAFEEVTLSYPWLLLTGVRQ